MARGTSSFGMVLIQNVSRKILDANDNRLYYSIQNHDATNFIAISPDDQVTAGIYGVHEGQHLTAGQPMSDDTDLAEVWGIVDNAQAAGTTVNITVQEVSTKPKGGRPPRMKGPPDNPRVGKVRPKPRFERRRELRPLASRMW